MQVENCNACPVQADCGAMCNIALLILRAEKIEQDRLAEEAGA